MFIALFIIAKIWKQPKCPMIDRWIKKMLCVCVCVMEYYLAIKKEWNLAICDNINVPWGYDAKWNKSGRERQHMISLIGGISNTKQMNKHNKREADS